MEDMSDHTMCYCCFHLSYFGRFRSHLIVFEARPSHVLLLIQRALQKCLHSVLCSRDFAEIGQNTCGTIVIDVVSYLYIYNAAIHMRCFIHSM